MESCMRTSKIVQLMVIGAGLAWGVSSCVPARQFEEVKAEKVKCEEDRQRLKDDNLDLTTAVEELKAQVAEIGKTNDALKRDTLILSNSLAKLTKQYDKINNLNDQLLRKQQEIQNNSLLENRKLLMQLEATREELQLKEDDLKKLEADLNAKEKNLNRLNGELKQREERVKELESLIEQKDAAARMLKDRVAEALLGYADKGLTVEMRNGKIYVSLDNKLLFASGSTTIEPEGRKALDELAKVLANETELGIVVEGHTDTDKFAKGSKIEDNWELSVLRSVSVVRILTKAGGLNPAQVTAAGRSEFVPLDPSDSAEAKAKNRRIEIILTPNLDKLFEILENN